MARLDASNPNSLGGAMTYYLSYGDGFRSTATADFQINTTSGVITTARNIGYEGGKSFVVSIPLSAVLLFAPLFRLAGSFVPRVRTTMA